MYMVDNVIYNKADIIERCIKRINEEYGDNPQILSLIAFIFLAVNYDIDRDLYFFPFPNGL